MALFKPDAPDYPELSAEELRDQTQAVIDVMTDPRNVGKTIAAERQQRPEYLEMSLADIWGTTMGIGDQEGTLSLLEQIAPRLSELQADAMGRQREADIEDVERLGARTTQALRASDPQMQSLLQQQGTIVDQLFGRAQGVTPRQQRMAQQQARESGMARGRAFGQGTIASEILGREQFQRQNREEYLGAAGQRFGMLKQTGADPFQAILGRPSQILGAAQQQQGFGAGTAQSFMGPQLFDPNQALNVAMMERANQANYNANIFASDASMYGATVGAIGNIGGAIFGGG